MSGSNASVTAIPTGGAVMLALPGYMAPPAPVAGMSIARSVSGSGVWTTIYSGAVAPFYIDCGDLLPAPLASGTAYLWQISDAGGDVQVGPVTPASTVLTTPDMLTQLFMRLVQGGLNCLTLPAGIAPVQATTRMPVGGWQAMPFILINLDLLQQTETQIGEDVPNPDPDNHWSIWVNAKRVWRVSVFSPDAEERDYYRDALLTIFRVLKATAFAPIGYNVSHSFQAASGTNSKEWEGHLPGFYFADIMMEINGVFDIVVLTNYNTIQQINVNPTLGPPGEGP